MDHMLHLQIYTLYIYTYMHLITTNEKGGHEFGGEGRVRERI